MDGSRCPVRGMNVQRTLGLTTVIALITASSAAAQSRPVPRSPPNPPLVASTSRVFVSVNGGFQVASNDFTDGLTFSENAENGRLDSDYSVKSGPTFDLSGGVIVWKNLGIGVGLTRFSHSTPAAITASVPHPFFFNQPRSINGEAGGLKREELGVHVQARLAFPISQRFQVMVFGGPSFYSVKQGLVNDAEYGESYPYDVVTFDRANSSTAEESKMGINAGGDVGFFFTEQLGVGFGVQYAGATVDLPSAGGGTIEVKAGGLQVGGGLRLRF
jgi:hypothetical protein